MMQGKNKHNTSNNKRQNRMFTSSKSDIVRDKGHIVLGFQARVSGLFEHNIASSHGCHMGPNIGQWSMDRNMCKAIEPKKINVIWQQRDVG